MKNKWKYEGLGQVKYGHLVTYTRPMEWLDEIGGTIEDWGCGCAYARRFAVKSKYLGIDGSKNEYADRCGVDLREYFSRPECILLRHVIDHNEDWRKVLKNAMESFQKRMVVIIFHDLGNVTKVLFRHGDPKFPGVVDMQFALSDLMEFFKPVLVRTEFVAADKESPNNNTLFYLEKL